MKRFGLGQGRRRAARLATAALVAILTPGLAMAQINPFHGVGANQLTGEDMRMIIDTSSKLLARMPLETGAAENWSNERTGASGSVRVTNTLHRHSLLCHTLAYHAHARARVSLRDTSLVWCRDSEGEWKIAS